MAIKRPDIYEHNNPNLPIADSDFVRGGVRSAVQNLNDLYALTGKADQLKQHSTQIYVSGENKIYLLKDANNVGNVSGWEEFNFGGGSNIVYTTGNQTVSGVKNFVTRPTLSGFNLITTGDLVDLELKILGDIVYLTGNQTISGVKTFASRPTVNGTGVLLSGEAAQADLSSTVRTTGDQTISGNKTFATTVNFANGFALNIPSKDSDSRSFLGSDIIDFDDFGTQLFVESGMSGLSSIYRARNTFGVGFGIVFGSIRGSGVSARKGYLTASGGLVPTGLEFATLVWTDRILSGQWKTNQKLLVNNTGVLLSGEAVASNGTVTRMIKLTQAQYNALSPVDPTTFYVIVG